MVGYTGVPGRAAYLGEHSDRREFSLWMKQGDPGPLVYVYVPKSRLALDRPLEILCDGALDVESGFMVTRPRWDSRVTAEGNLRAHAAKGTGPAS